jgi:hypothetical protein
MDGFCTKSMAASKDTPRTRGSAGLPTAGPSDGKNLKVDNGYRGDHDGVSKYERITFRPPPADIHKRRFGDAIGHIFELLSSPVHVKRVLTSMVVQ